MRTSFHHQSEAQPPNGPLTAATSPDTPSTCPATECDRNRLLQGGRRLHRRQLLHGSRLLHRSRYPAYGTNVGVGIDGAVVDTTRAGSDFAVSVPPALLMEPC